MSLPAPGGMPRMPLSGAESSASTSIGTMMQMMTMPPSSRSRTASRSEAVNSADFTRILQHQLFSGVLPQPQLHDAVQIQPSGGSATGSATTVQMTSVLTQYVSNQFVSIQNSPAAQSSVVQQPMHFDMTDQDDPMDDDYGTPRSDEADSWAVVGTNTMEPVERPYSDHESRREDNDTMCIICLNAEITHRLMPCQHGHFCGDCAAFICAGAVRLPAECPLCRMEVTDTEEITQEMAVDQQAERPQASRDVTTYAFLLRLARRPPVPAPAQENQSVSGAESPAPQTDSSLRPGTRSGLHAGLTMMSRMSNQSQPQNMTNMFGPWWPDEEPEGHYLNKLTLDEGEIGLLPDTGAHDGLCGSVWAVQQANLCRRAGKAFNQKLMAKPRSVQGVGNGSQTAQYEVSLTAGLQDTSGNLYEEVYTAPCLENSAVPGLMGIQSLERNDALIRCKTGEIWFLGRGGAKIEPSPGSRHFQMRKARSGHWLLPISKFGSNGAKSAGITLTTSSATASSTSAGGSSSSSSR